MDGYTCLNQTLNKQLSDEELKDFLSRAVVQLNQELTQDLLSIVSELISLRAAKNQNNYNGEHAQEFMERHPYGYYDAESNYGVDEDE